MKSHKNLMQDRNARQKYPPFRLTAVALAVATGTASAGVVLDQKPLSVSTPPPPNILLMLDDSGSMQWPYMPDTVPRFTGSLNTARYYSYTRNSIWYNPHVTYEPWANQDASLMPDANYNSVSTHHSRLSTANWSNGYSGNAEMKNTGWTTSTVAGTMNLSADNQIFHAKTSPTLPDDQINSHRAYILVSGMTATALECSPRGDASDISGCTPISSFTWNDGTNIITRTVEQERQNFANWFQYYRTRSKMAKASLTHAFSGLGPDFRVGFATINDAKNNYNSTSTSAGIRMTIPTTGTFGIGQQNRKDWFDEVFTQTPPNSNTPLLRALDKAGRYYSSTSNSGPWGPPMGVSNQHLSCRRSYTILTSDGFWNDADPTGIANEDGTPGPTSIVHATGTPTYTYAPTAPFEDGHSLTLADVAMKYWKTDLRPDLDNNLPTGSVTPGDPDQNGAFWQHMTTFTISIGLKGTLDPITDWAALKAGTKAWPNPRAGASLHKIDDLYHAAVNSRGKFIVASNPQEFRAGLIDALSAISVQPGSGVGLAASSTFAGDDVRQFQARFTTGEWTGDVWGYATDSSTGAIDTSTAPWKASEKLPVWSNRKIFANVNGNLQPFNFGNLSGSQRAALNNDSNLVDYLRGDQSKEAANNSASSPGYRKRTGVLGDFVNSTPLHVGVPVPAELMQFKSAYLGANTYAAYASSQATRTQVVYAGSNDGMLHGFNADTGEEVFAFVPNAAIQGGLKDLAIKPLDHRYYVDGELASQDVYINGGWRTVLVGSMGRGGRAIYALDVTNPNSVSLLWEIDSNAVPAIGNIIGKPKITQVSNGQWRVIVGSGPNNSTDTARLLVIDLASGSTTVVNTNAATNNGLMGVSIADINGDGFAERAYAGDLRGNMWRFDNLDALAGPPSSSLLFTATTGTPQPITAEPTLARNPATNDIWVFFGTGRYLNTGDLTDTSLQTWYGLIDDDSPITSRSDLVERKIETSTTISGRMAQTISEGSEGDMDGKRGWYLDLKLQGGPNEGERIVTPGVLRGSTLWTTTNIPDGSDPCTASGRGFLMYVSAFTGTRTQSPQIDLNGDGIIDSADTPSRQENPLGTPVGGPLFVEGNPSLAEDGEIKSSYCVVDSSGNIECGDLPARNIEVRTSSWRELVN